MDGAGPSRPASGLQYTRKRTKGGDEPDAPKSKKAQKGKKLPTSHKGKQKRKTPVASRSVSQPVRPAGVSAPTRTLEQVFEQKSEEWLKEKVQKEIGFCRKNHDTLAKAVCHLNGNFKKFASGACDSRMLFDYIERHELLEPDDISVFMPVDVTIERADSSPDILNHFLKSWWDNGRSFSKFYQSTKNKLTDLKTTPGESWHALDVINNSPLLKQHLQQLSEQDLESLYQGVREKSINQTGRLLLAAHVQEKALVLYLSAKLENGESLNAIRATLSKAQVPPETFQVGCWQLKELFFWLEQRIPPESELYSLLLEQMPISSLARMNPSDENFEFYLACVIKNWLRKNGTLSNFVQHISEKGVMLPGWAQSWSASTIARILKTFFNIQTLFPVSWAVIEADYKSSVDNERRKQLGLELLVRACAGEAGALKAYIRCRLFAGEEHRERDLEGTRQDSRKTDCEQIANKLNKTGVPCPPGTVEFWTGKLVDNYVSGSI